MLSPAGQSPPLLAELQEMLSPAGQSPPLLAELQMCGIPGYINNRWLLLTTKVNQPGYRDV